MVSRSRMFTGRQYWATFRDESLGSSADQKHSLFHQKKFTVPLDDGPSRQAGSRDSLPIGKGSGDLAQLVKQITTNRGGRVTTNALPAVKMSWLRQSRLNQDIIIVDGDHFTEVQRFLEQAYGNPDASFSSLAHVNGCSITYTPAQIGVVLNLTGGLGMTIVSIIGK
jgi:hypothetical protein